MAAALMFWIVEYQHCLCCFAGCGPVCRAEYRLTDLRADRPKVQPSLRQRELSQRAAQALLSAVARVLRQDR